MSPEGKEHLRRLKETKRSLEIRLSKAKNTESLNLVKITTLAEELKTTQRTIERIKQEEVIYANLMT